MAVFMKKLVFFSLATASLHSPLLFSQTNNSSDATELEVINVLGNALNFGATKSEISVEETPRSLSIISKETIKKRGALTVEDSLNNTAGVISNQFGFATRSDSTSIRGLPAPQYQDNLQTVFGFFNNTRADVYTLEQVEVLKGPASVLYGQAAPGGIVSLVSKVANPKYVDQDEVVLSIGNNNRFRVASDLGFNLSGDGTWTGRLVSVLQNSDTQVDFVEDDAFVFAPSVTYQNDKTTLTALFNYTKDEGDTASQFLPLAVTACGSSQVSVTGSNLCTGTSGQQVDNNLYVGEPDFNKFDSESTTLSLFATHQINDVFSFNGTARYRENDSDYQQTWVTFGAPGTPRVAADGTAFSRTFFDSISGTDQLAFDGRLLADFNTGVVSHQLALGLNYQKVNQTSNDGFFFTGPTTGFNLFNPVYDGSDTPTSEAAFDGVRFITDSETEAIDVYLTNHSTIGNLIVNSGIRFSSVNSEDGFNDQDDSENPITLGLLYKTNIGLNPYINYSESFLATVGTDVVSGTPLLPQEGEQLEVGFKYQPSDTKSFFTLSYFDIEQSNLVEFLAAGTTQSGDSAEISGVELEAHIQAGEFTVDLNVTHLDAENISSTGVSSTFESQPENTASLWVNWTPESGILKDFSFGSGVRYADSNESSAGSLRIVTDGYTVYDTNVIYSGFKNLDLSLNIRNLTNEEFFATCLARGDCFPGEERTIVAQAAYKF